VHAERHIWRGASPVVELRFPPSRSDRRAHCCHILASDVGYRVDDLLGARRRPIPSVLGPALTKRQRCPENPHALWRLPSFGWQVPGGWLAICALTDGCDDAPDRTLFVSRACDMDYGALNKTPGVTPGPTLGLPKYALTVQVKDGWTAMRQGPYLSEGAGGYLVFKADDFDAAVELASRIPAGPRRRRHHRDGRFHQGHLAKSAEIDRLEAGIAHKI
jgi:hypothetical protein